MVVRRVFIDALVAMEVEKFILIRRINLTAAGLDQILAVTDHGLGNQGCDLCKGEVAALLGAFGRGAEGGGLGLCHWRALVD